ncbi:unnamed protein product, partial [marine sediment metagenome]
MKKLLSIFVVCFVSIIFMVSLAFALPHTVNKRAVWDANPEADVDGYKVYYSTSSDLGTFADAQSIDVGDQTFCTLDTIPMNYWIALTCNSKSVFPIAILFLI